MYVGSSCYWCWHLNNSLVSESHETKNYFKNRSLWRDGVRKRRLHKSIYRSIFFGKSSGSGGRGGIGEVVIMWREQFFASGDAFRPENRPLPVCYLQKPSRDLLLSYNVKLKWYRQPERPERFPWISSDGAGTHGKYLHVKREDQRTRTYIRYREVNKGLYVVAWNLFRLLLNCFAWPCLQL